MPEAVLCVKAVNEKARAAAYDLIAVIGEVLRLLLPVFAILGAIGMMMNLGSKLGFALNDHLEGNYERGSCDNGLVELVVCPPCFQYIAASVLPRINCFQLHKEMFLFTLVLLLVRSYIIFIQRCLFDQSADAFWVLAKHLTHWTD